MDALEGGPGSGLVATVDGDPAGLITWFVAGTEAEIRALAVDPRLRGRGVGGLLLREATDVLWESGVRRAWLVTTNDNLAALGLYQKAGWRLAALRPGAVDALRETLKPSIPALGEHGIPLRDELELELSIEDPSAA